MQIHKNLVIGKEMGLEKTFILDCRRRYLTQQLWEIEELISENINEPWQSDGDVALFLFNMKWLESEKEDIKKELKVIDRIAAELRQSTITDEMIERARHYPVELLVEFTRGKTRAWCHEDRNPSMFHGTRNNLAVCPVCDKKFGPIDILMVRDGMNFRDAVRQLQ